MLNSIGIHYARHNRKVDSGLLAFFLFASTLILTSASFMYYVAKNKLLVKIVSDYIHGLIKKQPYNPLLNLINCNKSLFSTLDSFTSNTYTKFNKILIIMSSLLVLMMIMVIIFRLYYRNQNKKNCNASEEIKHNRIDYITFPLVFFGLLALTGIALIIPIVLTFPKSLTEFLYNNIGVLQTHNNGMIEILKKLIHTTFKDNDIVQKTIDGTRNTLFIITSVSIAICIIASLCYLFHYINSERNNASAQSVKNKNLDALDVTQENSTIELHLSY